MSELTHNFDDLLDSVPTPSDATEEHSAYADGRVLRVPLARRWYNGKPFSWLLPFRQHRSLRLDGPGNEVWGMCDGQTTMEAIIDRFSLAHHISFHEARIAVAQYVRVLTRNGLLALVGAAADGEAE